MGVAITKKTEDEKEVDEKVLKYTERQKHVSVDSKIIRTAIL